MALVNPPLTPIYNNSNRTLTSGATSPLSSAITAVAIAIYLPLVLLVLHKTDRWLATRLLQWESMRNGRIDHTNKPTIETPPKNVNDNNMPYSNAGIAKNNHKNDTNTTVIARNPKPTNLRMKPLQHSSPPVDYTAKMSDLADTVLALNARIEELAREGALHGTG